MPDGLFGGNPGLDAGLRTGQSGGDRGEPGLDPGCRCQADPPQRHGPYYQWSRAIAGKTVSRRLNQAETELYQGWIANRRRLEQIIDQMEEISATAGELLLPQAGC